MGLDWDWAFVVEILPSLTSALGVTVVATLLGSAVALVLGLVFAVARMVPSKVVAGTTAVFVGFIRSTPLLVQIYFLFYVMPRFGLLLSPMVTGVVALGLHYASYTAEVYRAGIESVSRGQWEAATALSLSRSRTFFRVVLPQALPPVVPALGNYVIAMFKETPLLSTITVLELVYTAKDIGSQTFRYLEPFTLVGAMFLLVSLVAAAVVRLVERRLPAYAS